MIVQMAKKGEVCSLRAPKTGYAKVWHSTKLLLASCLLSTAVVQVSQAIYFSYTAPIQQAPTQTERRSDGLYFSDTPPALITVKPSTGHRGLFFTYQDAVDVVAQERKDSAFFRNLSSLEQDMFPLSIAIEKVLDQYSPVRAKRENTGLVFFSSSSTQATQGASQSVDNTPPPTFNQVGVSTVDKTIFGSFYQLLASPVVVDVNLTGIIDIPAVSSYLGLINYVWQAYSDHIKKLTSEGKTVQVQADAQAAFYPNSTPLNFYNQLSNQLLIFISLRLGMFSVDSFGSPGSFYFLNHELPQLDALMKMVEKTFSDRMSGSSGDGFPSVAGLAGADAATLTDNYLAISKEYARKKTGMMVKFCFQLFEALNVRCSMSAALSGMQTTLLGYELSNPDIQRILVCLNDQVYPSTGTGKTNQAGQKTNASSSYFTLGQAGLLALSEENPLPSVGVYKTPQLALQQLARLSGEFYLYAALVGKNKIESLCNTPAALVSQNTLGEDPNQNSFQQQVQVLIAQTQNFYGNAAQAFAQQYDIARSSAYNQISGFLNAGLQYWVKAIAYAKISDFQDAIIAYQQASEMFKRTGLLQLTTIMLRKSDAATLVYYQSLLESYTQYYQLPVSNQQTIPTIIQQMSTPPADNITFQEATDWHTTYPTGLVQLFYYDPGTPAPTSPPTFRGIGWLAQNALPSFLTMLTMYQTDTTPAGQSIKPYLSQSLTVLKNLAQGIHGIFYNDPLAASTSLKNPTLESVEGKAADANIGSFTVQGAVEGRLQYMKIYELLEKVDSTIAAYSAQGNQPFPLPFQGLFDGQMISGFADFSALTYLYWSLMNVDPCLAQITSSVNASHEYTQSLVSTALITLVYAQAACNDPALTNTLSSNYPGFIEQKLQAVLATTYQVPAVSTKAQSDDNANTSAISRATGANYAGKSISQSSVSGKGSVSAVSPLQLLIQEGQLLLSKAVTALDYESAIACFQVAAILEKIQPVPSGQTTAQALYESALQQQANWYLAHQSEITFSALAAAFAQYRIVLAQAAGWRVGSKSGLGGGDSLIALQDTQQLMFSFLKEFSGQIQQLEGVSDTQAFQVLKTLSELQDEIGFLLVRQTREQQLLGFFEPASSGTNAQGGAATQLASSGTNTSGVGTQASVAKNSTGVTVQDLLAIQTSSASTGPAMNQIPQSIVSGSQPLIIFSSPLLSTATAPFVLPTLVDPKYNSAQFYYDEGARLLQKLQEDFSGRMYQGSVQQTYTKISQNFAQAAQYFAEGDYQEQVVMVQQAITNATAFAYFSSVIPAAPTESLIDTLLKKMTLAPTFFENQPKHTIVAPAQSHLARHGLTFTYAAPTVSSTIVRAQVRRAGLTFTRSTDDDQPVEQSPTVQPTAFPLIPAAQPDYLVRYFEYDLTVNAAQEQQATTAQAAVNLAQHPAVVAAQKTGLAVVLPPVAASYQSLLQTAQTLLGKEKTIQTSGSYVDIVTSVVAPYYRKILVDGGFSSQFITLDNEVERYKNQVIQLVQGGIMMSDNSRLFAQYTLEKRTMSDKTEHIILVVNNGPLQALPRFQSETETALFYYTQYAQFFAIVPAMVQVGQSVFYQIPDPTGDLKGAAYKYIIGSYLAKLTDYMNIIKNCMKMAPPKVSYDTLKEYSFSLYSKTYQTLQSAYQWLFSVSGSLSDAQTNSGVHWMASTDLNTVYFENYTLNMTDTRRFLVGSPFDVTYKNILNQISGLGSMALSVTQSASQEVTIYSMLGDCYNQAGETEILFTDTVPSAGTMTNADGYEVPYPSTGPTNIPLDQLDFTQNLGSCVLPAANVIQSPQPPFTITWERYYNSAEYLMQAIKKYTSAYTVVQTGSDNAVASDPHTQNAFGMTILYMMRAVTQRLALFGRNAFTATVTQNISGDNAITLGTSSQFDQILNQGQNGGAASVASGYAALSGGAAVQTNSALVQQQYNLMKQLLIDGMIYGSYVVNAVADLNKQLSKGVKFVKNAQDVVGGQALKCAVGYYMPGLQMLAAKQIKVGAAYEAGTVGENKTEDVETEISVLAYQDISIQKLGIPDIKQLACSNTLPAFMDYCMTTLMQPYYDSTVGLVQFAGLEDPAHVAALNDFASQIYFMMREIYTWEFLPPQASGVSAATYAENNKEAIDAALKAVEQNMTINSESYVG